MADTRKYAASTPTGGDGHLDAPLTQMAVKAFTGGADTFVAPRLLPFVTVDKQSNKYYIIDPDSWLLIPNTRRSPKVAPRRIEWKVSSDSYFANNYALAGENALEDLANADAALALRENTTQVVVEALLRDLEVRVANLVSSVSNVGSGVVLSGTNKWSDYTGSDPISDVTTGHAFIRQTTGLLANTLVMDRDTYETVRRHPLILDMFKYTRGGLLSDEELRGVFKVDNLWVPQGIKNNALEAATSSITNIWGNTALLARVQPGLSMQTATFGLSFIWEPDGVPGTMQVLRYNDPDPGKKVEVIEAGYYADNKVIAKNLAYAITTTL